MTEQISPQDWLNQNKGKNLNDYFNAFPNETTSIETKEEKRDVQNKPISRYILISIVITCIAVTILTILLNNPVKQLFSNKIDSSSDLYNTEWHWEDESHSIKMKFADNTNSCLMTLVNEDKTLNLSFEYALFNDQIELQPKEDFGAILIPSLFGTVQSIKIKINSDNTLTLPVANNKTFTLTQDDTITQSELLR